MMNAIPTKKTLLLLLLVIGNVIFSTASDFYWINGSGDWNDPAHWSNSSGGSSLGTVPGKDDNAIFDRNSFTHEFSTVSIKRDVSIHNLTVNSPKYASFYGELVNMTIHGNLDIVSKTGFSLAGAIHFNNDTRKKNKINTSAIDFYTDLIFEKGDWEITNHLKTGQNNTISFEKGKFYSNGYSVHAENILANKSSYDLDFTDSHISVLAKFDVSKADNIGGNATYHVLSDIVDEDDIESFTLSGDETKDAIVFCIGSPLELEIIITSDYNGADISCKDSCDGEITVIASGTPGPFSYRYGPAPNPFGPDSVFSDLCVENHSVTVMDSSNEISPGNYYRCTIDEDLNEPSVLTFDPPVTINPTCPEICNGQAFTFPAGGTGVLDVFWPETGETTHNPVMLCVGPNPVQITDENGCTISDTVHIVEPFQIVADPIVVIPTCAGDCDGAIVLNPSGGNGGPYSFNWTPAPTSGVDTNPGDGFCAGDIDLTIFDVNGCEFDTTITIADPPVFTIDVIDIVPTNCNGDCFGEATANPTGGIPPYSYEWFDAGTGLTTGITDQTAVGLCAGDYFVVSTDDNGCIKTSANFTIDEPSPFVFNVDVYPTSCFDLCDGAADIDITGGTPPYSFSWEAVPSGVGIGATDSISGLCPGNYQIIVTDDNFCETPPVTVEVLNPADISISIDASNPTCYDLCDGTANATVSGGTPGYSFAWLPSPITGDGTPNASGLCADIEYTLVVTDDNGCSRARTTTLASPPEFDITSVVTSLDCFGDTNGAIDLTVASGGSGTGYTYTWSPTPPVGDGTPNVSNLTAGVWMVSIADSEGCDTTLSFNITSPTELNITASIISDLSCNGVCNGSAEVTISGGTAPYTILWDDPLAQTTLVATGLCAGPLNVVVTDGNGCTRTASLTLSEPAEFDLSTSQTNIDCFGDCDGTATVTVNSGGTAPYTILWDDPLAQTTFTAISLCAGTYTATLRDNNLCDSTLTFTIVEPTELLVSATVIDSACFGECTGSASVTPTGGTLPYTYEWFNATTGVSTGFTTAIVTDLCAGDYFAIVTDGNGCSEQSVDINVFELPEIVASIVSTTDATCAVCDGTAEISATGGDGDLTFDWVPDPLGGDGTTSVTGLCAGAYTVNIVDGSTCSQTLTVSIDDIALEVLDLDSVDITCFGDCDGEASVSFTELSPPYTIEWFDNVTGLTTGIFGSIASGLCAGEYLVVVTNSAGCVKTGVTTINEPTEIVGSTSSTHISCNGLCDGTAAITVSGGVEPYSYDWGPGLPGSGEGTPNVSGLCGGVWVVGVLDAGGCLVPFPVTVNEPTPIVIDAESSTNVSCFGDTDGSASVIVSGGTAPYSYEWFDCATGLAIGQTDPLATGLAPGDYQCVITDDKGCTTISSCIPVDDVPEITAIITTENISCFGECDGIISAVPSGGAGTYFFQWLDNLGNPIAGQTNDSLENACSDIYSLEITDLNGCNEVFGPIDMTSASAPWDVVPSQTNVSCSGSCDGTATVIVLGGNTPPYTYLWDDPLGQVTPTANFLCEGLHTVTISDAGSCDTTIVFNIVNNNPIYANMTDIQNINCFGECTGQITVDPIGGVAPYTLNWSDGQTGLNATGLCQGTITLSITDAVGCTKDTTFNLTESPEITTTSSFSNNTTCGLCNGSATVNVSGGVAPYTYDWEPDPVAGEGTNNATGLCPGVVSVTITDNLGCTFVETFGITDIPGEDITMSATDASCFGVCDGTATATYVCSDPPCVQEWFDGATGISLGLTTATVTGLCAGEYFVRVTNASDCITVDSISVSSPTEIFANETLTPLTCPGGSDASISVAPSGGSGAGYTYSWSPIPPNGDGTNEALNLGAGLWEVTITDGNGCSQTFSFNISNPLPINLVVDPSDPTCSGLCNGTILATASDGAGGFTFQWFMGGTIMPGETSPLLTGLCPGNYNVEVTDANGCTVSLPTDVTLVDPVPISATITNTNISCFGVCDGTASVTVVGGVAPYTINWYNGLTGSLIGISGADATGLCVGSYFAIITDVNGCNFTTATINVTEPSELVPNLTTVNNDCFGSCNGSANVTSTGGTPAYTYEWLTISGDPIIGGTTPSVVDLCDGNYTIEVTDNNGCSTGLIPFSITGSDEITGSIFSNDANCGVANGNATIFASGGSAPYTYQWFDVTMTALPGETNNILLNVISGIYFVTVTDDNGCNETFIATIDDLESSDITFDAVNNPTCFGECDGSIEVTIAGEHPPFVYSWNPGGIIAEDPTGLCAGDYLLEVIDDFGCRGYSDTTLLNPSEIIVDPTITATNCGECNGEITLSFSGGVAPYSVVWNNGETSTSLTGLCAGIYEATVTASNGCSVTKSFSVENSVGLSVETSSIAITCPEACDGEITVNGIGGTAPYAYLWLHDASTSNSLTGLCAGSYFVQVTDATGCVNTSEIELLDPNSVEITPIVVNPTCGASNGSIVAITEGGIAPYTHLWSTGSSASSILGLSAAVYNLTVTDANGCSVDFSYPLSNITAPSIELVSTDVNCFGECNGTIDTLQTIGGSAPFSFGWLSEEGTPLGTSTPLISGLCAGIYTLQVTDASGCISLQSAAIESPDTILVNPLFTANTLCNGECDGIITSNPFGGALPFTFSWDDPTGQNTFSATGLCAGDYTVTMTDANGCSTQQTATIVEPTLISIVIDSITPSSCSASNDGGIFITTSGGLAGYTYEWTNDMNADVLTAEDPVDLLPFKYYLKVTDANGCEYFDTITVDTLTVIIADAGPDTSVCNNGSLILTGTSNILVGATYAWLDTSGTILSDSTQLVISSVGESTETYILQVDFLGCVGYDTVNVNSYVPVSVDAGDNIELLAIQTKVIGGDPTTDPENTVVWSPPTYLSDINETNPSVIQPQESAWYVVTATDVNGCTNTDSVFVEVLPAIIIPDGISPNGDGKNDTWILDFIEQYPGVSVNINVYNRWGDKLFTANENYANDWGGLTEEGKRLPAGTYYFVINVDHENFPDPITGPLTIMW